MEAKNKNTLIGGLLAIIFVMAVGYAAFSTQLNISGTATVDSKWDVHIKSISVNEKSATASDGVAAEGSNPAVVTQVDADNDLMATFGATLTIPGDYVTYDVVVENSGTLDAKLADISFTSGNTDVITITHNAAKNSTISHTAGSNTYTFQVTVRFATASGPTNGSDITTEPASSQKYTNATKLILTYEQA